MTGISNPHDHFFKETFTDISVVQQFAKHYFPEHILRIIDTNTLKILKDSFVEEKLTTAYSDLLFSVKIENKQAYMYFLFEHKSYQDHDVSLQLLSYMTAIWKQARKKERKKQLPFILPIVFYHGRDEWKQVQTIGDLLMIHEKDLDQTDLLQYAPDFEFLFYDFSPHSSLEIKGNEKLQAYLLLVRAIFSDNINEVMEIILEIDRLLEHNMHYFKTVIVYFFTVRKKGPVEKLKDQLTKEGRREFMSFANKLREEGRQEGVITAKTNIIKKLLKLQIEDEKIIEAAEVTPEQLEQIKQSLEKNK